MRGTSALVVCVLALWIQCTQCQTRPDETIVTGSPIQDIHDSNADRRSEGRVFSAFIYLFICMGYLCLTTLLAVFLGWLWQPQVFANGVKKFKAYKGKHAPAAEELTQWNTVIWQVILYVIVTVMGAGGMPGWMVLGFLLFVACVCISVVSFLTSRAGTGKWFASAQQVVPQDAEAGTVCEANKPLRFTEHPLPLGYWQKRLAVGLSLFMLVFLLLVLVLFYSWQVSDYKLWHLNQKKETVEFIPQVTAKAIGLMYSWEGLASNLKSGIYAKIATSYCGRSFTQTLNSESEKETEIYDAFVKKYDIDMTVFDPPDWKQYDSVNAWFIRKILRSERPVNPQYDAPGLGQIVSPADARLLIFPTLDDSKIWIKGSRFNYADLLCDDDLANEFEGGVMVIARLAPQDYHRFNTPMGGNITLIKEVEGSYWSVNPDAVVSGNHAFYNLRKVLIIENPQVGKIAYVAIGATCVGSVIIRRQVGEQLTVGTELGFMQFGGSTVILLFQKGRANFHRQVVENSKLPVESYVTVNSWIGTPNP